MFEFIKYGSRLYPLEEILINEVVNNAPDCYRGKLRKQIESVNKIQRHEEFKEINLYPMRGGKPNYNQDFSLPYRETEHVICVIDFEFPNTKIAVKMKAWLVEGFLFSLTFNKSPKQYRKSGDVVIKKATQNFSSLTAQTTNQYSQKDKGDSQKLKELLGEHNFERIHPPISEIEKKEFSVEFYSVLPKDYIQLISLANGFEIDDWVVHGFKNIREVVGKDGNHYMLAETNDGYLTVEEESNSSEIFFLQHDQEATKMGNSFIKALKQCLNALSPGAKGNLD